MANTLSNRKIEIETAAARLFGEKGFAASSVRDIASAVGLGPASLYNHMASKEGLLKTICFRCAHQFLEGMATIEATEVDPIEKIEALIRLHIDIAFEDKSSVTVFNDEWRHLPEADLVEFLALRKNYERNFLRILKEGMDTGMIRPAEPFILYNWILSSLRWLHLPGKKKSKLSAASVTEQITQLIIKGIAI